MVKSVKGQFILSAVAAVLFVTGSFFYIEFTGEEEFGFTRIILYFAMVVSVYNAGMLIKSMFKQKRRNNFV